jgi:hypothetical protein
MNSADVDEPRKSDSGMDGKRCLALGSESLAPGERKKQCSQHANTSDPEVQYRLYSKKAPWKKRGDGAAHGISVPRPLEVMG